MVLDSEENKTPMLYIQNENEHFDSQVLLKGFPTFLLIHLLMLLDYLADSLDITNKKPQILVPRSNLKRECSMPQAASGNKHSRVKNDRQECFLPPPFFHSGVYHD